MTLKQWHQRNRNKQLTESDYTTACNRYIHEISHEIYKRPEIVERLWATCKTRGYSVFCAELVKEVLK